jgi:hypothetical protein
MKHYKLTSLLTSLGLLIAVASSNAASTEVTANLLSTIQRQSNGSPADTFSISFGSLNGGLSSLLTKDGSAVGAAGFATWYGANSRTLLNWGSVQGSAITDTDPFYKYYGLDSTSPIYKGAALTSKYDATKDNRALAFVTYSSGGTVEEIGLYDLGFDFANPGNGSDWPLGIASDFLTLSSDVTAIYGATSPSTGTYGSISTSNVPEPSSSLLLLVGGLALAGVRQFRKKI